MTKAPSSPISKAGIPILVFGVVLGIVGLALYVFNETHNAESGIDAAVTGEHVCFRDATSLYAAPLPIHEGRPNEESLYRDALLNAHQWDSKQAAQFPGYRPETSNGIENYKQHYLLEVRRTVTEFESGRPLNFPAAGIPGAGEIVDEETQVPISFRGCIVNTDSAQYAHDCARRDVLRWYAQRGRYAANSQKQRKG